MHVSLSCTVLGCSMECMLTELASYGDPLQLYSTLLPSSTQTQHGSCLEKENGFKLSGCCQEGHYIKSVYAVS